VQPKQDRPNGATPLTPPRGPGPDEAGLATGDESSGALDEQEKQVREDYEWCLHDAQVQQEYQGRVVAVHKRKIWGAGRTHRQATRAALRCPGCPPREALAKVFIEGRPLNARCG
jgi:hypothetical protein